MESTLSHNSKERHRLEVYENIWRISGSTGKGFTDGWRKLQKERFHNFKSSPNIIRMIKSRTMRWAGLVERMT
jgi:hypothetical protein